MLVQSFSLPATRLLGRILRIVALSERDVKGRCDTPVGLGKWEMELGSYPQSACDRVSSLSIVRFVEVLQLVPSRWIDGAFLDVS